MNSSVCGVCHSLPVLVAVLRILNAGVGQFREDMTELQSCQISIVFEVTRMSLPSCSVVFHVDKAR